MGWWSGTKATIESKITDPAKYNVSEQLGGYLKSMIGKPLPRYPGMEDLTKMNASEEAGMGLLENYVSGQSPLNAATMKLVYGILSGDTGYLKGIESPIMRELQNVTLPTIEAAYGKGGTYFGTQRADAERAAAETASAGVMENAAKLFPQAMNLGATIEPGMIEASQKYGALPRSLKTLDYQEWLRTQPENSPLLNIANQYQASEGGGITSMVQPGVQGASSGIAGGNCCWTFLKGKKLTESVRRFRDKYFSKESWVSNGYKKMSGWLVPAMDNKFIMKLVQTIMLNPMSEFTKYHEEHNIRDMLYVPICVFWVLSWEFYGRIQCIKT